MQWISNQADFVQLIPRDCGKKQTTNRWKENIQSGRNSQHGQSEEEKRVSENGATNDYFSLLYGVPVIGEKKREKSPPDFVAFNYATTGMFCGIEWWITEAGSLHFARYRVIDSSSWYRQINNYQDQLIFAIKFLYWFYLNENNLYRYPWYEHFGTHFIKYQFLITILRPLILVIFLK